MSLARLTNASVGRLNKLSPMFRNALLGTRVQELEQTKTVRVALAAAETGGGMLSWANPEGATIIVTRLIVDITTGDTGGDGTADFGVAANGTTTSDILLDGISTAAAAVFDNVDDTDNGTNGKTKQKVTSSQYVTGSAKTGTVAGTVGFAYITYMLAAATS